MTTQNPYSVSDTPVADKEPARREPPLAVRRAVWLLRISVAIGLVEIYLSVNLAGKALVPVIVSLAVIMLVIAAYLWVVQNVSKGRNWARLTVLIVVILGVVESLATHDSSRPLVFVLRLIDTLLDIIALALIFRRPGSQWFIHARH
jgi:hypothetical protein